jgi:hypothetical protein
MVLAGRPSTGYPMSCDDLAGTGVPVASILIVATTLLILGVLLVLASKSGLNRSASAVVVIVVLGALAPCLAGWSSARAAPAKCGSNSGPWGNAYLTINQTSVITGLAPGIAPAAITGVVVNHGLHDAYVDAITVNITSVTKASVATPGPCSADDYVLIDAAMPVGVLLRPGASASFAGASIGFQNKSVNQDACKAATVTLHYVASG